MVAGNYGQGRYVLSYSHLETPDSPDANAWLAHLLRVLAGLAPQRELVPAWDLHRKAAFRWPDTPQTAPLRTLLHGMRELLDWAWNTTSFSSALPGSGAGAPACPARSATTCIRPCACSAACVPARTPWPPGTACAPASPPLRTFSCPAPRAICWPAACARPSPPPCPTPVDRRGLTNQREALFGHRMTGGGIVGELLEMTDELLYRGQQEDACAALDD